MKVEIQIKYQIKYPIFDVMSISIILLENFCFRYFLDNSCQGKIDFCSDVVQGVRTPLPRNWLTWHLKLILLSVLVDSSIF